MYRIALRQLVLFRLVHSIAICLLIAVSVTNYFSGGELLQLVRNTKKEEGVNMIMEAIKDGRALEKFQNMIISQGVAAEIAKELCYGNPHLVLSKAQHETDIIYDGVTGMYIIFGLYALCPKRRS